MIPPMYPKSRKGPNESHYRLANSSLVNPGKSKNLPSHPSNPSIDSVTKEYVPIKSSSRLKKSNESVDSLQFQDLASKPADTSVINPEKKTEKGELLCLA